MYFKFFNGSEFINDSAGYRGWIGEWHQIAFTWKHADTAVDGFFCNTTVYIDGYYKPYYNCFVSSLAPAIADKFYVGCNTSNQRKANADIDELKIYRVALTEDQIYSHYTELFPVEFYAKETVFKFGTPAKTTVEVRNLQSTSIDGKIRCSIPNIGSWDSD